MRKFETEQMVIADDDAGASHENVAIVWIAPATISLSDGAPPM